MPRGPEEAHGHSAHRPLTGPRGAAVSSWWTLRSRSLLPGGVSSGQFGYRGTRPQDTDEEDVSAELADGVLSVKVLKAEKAKPRRIEIAG